MDAMQEMSVPKWTRTLLQLEGSECTFVFVYLSVHRLEIHSQSHYCLGKYGTFWSPGRAHGLSADGSWASSRVGGKCWRMLGGYSPGSSSLAGQCSHVNPRMSPCPWAAYSPLSPTAKGEFPMENKLMFMELGWETFTVVLQQSPGEDHQHVCWLPPGTRKDSEGGVLPPSSSSSPAGLPCPVLLTRKDMGQLVWRWWQNLIPGAWELCLKVPALVPAAEPAAGDFP